MLLTIATTHKPATDLGYLLHKHPDKLQSFSLSFGQAHVFYPEASSDSCMAALLLDVDPVGLVRKKGNEGLEQYVNDRPYVASSFLSVAISQVFGSALAGRCKDKPELTQIPIPLIAKLTTVPSRGGEALLQSLFAPLGYTIKCDRTILDAKFPQWGESYYYNIELHHTIPLQELLSHLYVLIPVLDDEKHYWVGEDEVNKLLRHGEGWLAKHPEQNLIAKRYLKRQGRLVRSALTQLVEDNIDNTEQHEQEEAVVEERISLNKQRLAAVLGVLKQHGAAKVIDLGCGEGKLLKELLIDKSFKEIVGVDVSHRALEIATERLHLERMPSMQRDRIKLLQGSLTYRDKRLCGYDAATVVEVIEHLDIARLATFERVLFEFAKPNMVVVTTPNVEYNVKFDTLPAGKLRHKDHRFEWTRLEFQQWGNKVAEKYNYSVQFLPIGDEDAEVGAPTQMAVFNK
ncbi:3' terminal RNA ribose 2'-O-methyltransferase Hen1 [Synechocystis sp. PCC 7509]|uniref:3' terminal RNA ribose 2'-O-methyltransferase Hen1 n=1 Tax=Synechocystis sp. PCC 7509 TaxID=927677 RepID=UPI0002AC5F2A|nr:3' terminal RNA ribose 2'-O-methyltransferase Hen1 [Synechocystis sp. PCC 7509]